MSELKTTKNYCAVNTKYYKDSQASGEIGHVLRSFKQNENCFPTLTKNNFGHTFSEHNLNIKQYYDIKLIEAKNSNNRALQKNSNTYIDSVLIFDRETFDRLLREGKQQELEQATIDFMTEFKTIYGFEPIGFEFHLDEGTELGSGEIKHNYHAHAIFLNYDFDKKKTCLRKMSKDDWRNSQSLLHKHFQHLGFDRGEVKSTNKKDHKEKMDYVRELKHQIKKLEQDNRRCETKNLMLLNDKLDLIDDLEEAEGRLENLHTAKEAVEDIAKVLRKKGLYQKLQRLIAKPIFDYLSGKTKLIYKALTGRAFHLDQSKNIEVKINKRSKNNTLLEGCRNSMEAEREKIKIESTPTLNGINHISKSKKLKI